MTSLRRGLWGILLLPFAGLLVSCPKKTQERDAEESLGVAADLDAFRRAWLEPARIAPPTIRLEPQEIAQGGYRIVAAPLRPEDAAWNRWPGGESRLFNNRAGLMFDVRAEGPGSLRWEADLTWMRLNGTGERIAAAASPEDLLLPLLTAALDEQRYRPEGDLISRTRAAGLFRGLYLPLSPFDPPLVAVLAFPLPDPEMQIVSVEVSLSFRSDEGPIRGVMTWE